jgi:hypothetical protein
MMQGILDEYRSGSSSLFDMASCGLDVRSVKKRLAQSLYGPFSASQAKRSGWSFFQGLSKNIDKLTSALDGLAIGGSGAALSERLNNAYEFITGQLESNRLPVNDMPRLTEQFKGINFPNINNHYECADGNSYIDITDKDDKHYLMLESSTPPFTFVKNGISICQGSDSLTYKMIKTWQEDPETNNRLDQMIVNYINAHKQNCYFGTIPPNIIPDWFPAHSS